MKQKNRKKRSTAPAQQKSLRLWPGLVAAILLLLAKLVVPRVVPDSLPIVLFGGLFLGVAIIVWWAFFSRAPVIERWGAVVLLILAFFAVRPFLHESIARAGMGMLFPILAIPILTLALALSAVISGRLSAGFRRVSMIAALLIATVAWTFVRTEGLNNSGNSDFAWRWSASPEEQLLARTDDEQTVLPIAAAEMDTVADWPGFRGAARDGIIRGVKIETDWSTSPPKELWRQPVGPGWSSFAVQGNLLYTQEQRGEKEVVSCYKTTTGDPVWQHNDETRFWESNSGAGPRGTPTLNGGRLYSLGGTGILNVLDARDGRVVWSRNVANDTDTKMPIWGFAGSPLVMDDIVFVSAAGSLIAYDVNTGTPRWSNPAGGDCYSSPHLLTISGIPHILLQNQSGVISVAPADGTLLWEHAWPGQPIVQPAQTSDGDILVSVDDRSGIRRLAVVRSASGWNLEERWTSDYIKPYFNDSVFHHGHVYGFDGPRLACLDAKDGARTWRGGRYGRGQFVLLADQDVLLVLSEKGELALVRAVPDQFTEIARMPAIEGKTWNHPVLIRDILLVRNAEEMAAFRVTLSF
ncbi:hypothetical protein EH223_10530 [candidate division KSB1 bacterium]|nr:PQQ-like beta-propeller repeat protein [candidate division KSB1 bacterium]RQW03193.1 MAG: hypothetical protein EH223_10530 [candidate division KSB1 bacterium]